MSTVTTVLAIGGLGTNELLIILAVLVLLFGASKLPELARGSGRALRIFKAETRGLMTEDTGPDAPSTSALSGIAANQDPSDHRTVRAEEA